MTETLLTLAITAPVILYFMRRHLKERKSRSAQTPRFAGRSPSAAPGSKGEHGARRTG